MSLINVIEEQTFFGFNGRVAVLDKKSREFFGKIILNNGRVVNCNYKNTSGLKSLYLLLIDDEFKKEDLDYIVEPETVGPGDFLFEIQLGELKTKAKEFFKGYKESLKYRPPDDLLLSVSASFIIEGEALSESEFDTLTVIPDYSKVSEIYKNTEYPDYEITLALINLRKKGAVKVLKKGN